MSQKDQLSPKSATTQSDTGTSVHDDLTYMHASDQAETLPLLPLKHVIILPKSIRPIIVGRASSIKAVEYALKNDKSIFLSTQKDPNTEHPNLNDLFEYGTRGVILQVMRMSNGTLKILVESLCRSKIIHKHEHEDFMTVEYQDVPTQLHTNQKEINSLWGHVQERFMELAKLNDKIPNDLLTEAITQDDMDTLCDTLAIHLNLSFENRQHILEMSGIKDRMLKLIEFMNEEIEILETEQRVRSQVQHQVEKNQREYYLTEQIKAIQKELGRDDQQDDLAQLKEKIGNAFLSPEARKKADKEIKRLEQMPPFSSEAAVARNYIDWIVDLPWNKESKDSISLKQAEKILNKHHAGLQKAKDRIVEFIAAKKYSPTLTRSPIICLIGPPGVGKTSLGKSIAESLGREFVRISLGGIRDEAEIRGHRRTYIGALPGKIIQAMRKASTVNPVILLDEIDKMAQDIHGDPASALLEVLDPEQNGSFADHFLDIEYDLSKVMFITTANMFDGIPYPLLDRMEIINISGYTEDEKLEIARKFLIPKMMKEHTLDAETFVIPRPILKKIITQYTKEAGVRQLERTIAKLMRKAIQELLKNKPTKTIKVTDAQILEWLGHTKFKPTSLDEGVNRIGLVTGLAWTELGGDVLDIEVSVLPGKGGYTLTGQLGDVMQESAQAALSYVRANAKNFSIKNSVFTNKDLHIHIPEGATPKDGPSAGITICAALISALTDNPTKASVTLTGEITLRGRVLAVGGLKEKILAAKQHGRKTVIVPKENEHDIAEIDETIKKDLDIIFVSTMDEILPILFAQNPLIKKSTKPKLMPRRKPNQGTIAQISA